MNPEISAVLDVAAAYFSEDENFQTGAHDPNRNGFNFQQLELSLASIVDPYFRFDSHLVLSQFGIEVEEAYGTTLSLPFGLQSRFGQFMHRFGRLNATHPHAWDFVDQPFVLGRVFGGESGRGLGVEASWLTPLPWYVELVVTSMQADGQATARSFYGGESLGVESPLDLLHVAALKQYFPMGHDASTFWGLSAAAGPNPTGPDNRTDVYGTDLYLEYRPITRQSQLRLSWQSELLYRRRQIPADALQDVGLYSQVVFQWSRHWAAGGRYELGTAADGTSPDSVDPLDPEWTDTRQRFTANLTHFPTEFSRFRLQGSHDLLGWRDRGIWAAFLAVELVVGAHGAHAY